MKLITVGLAVPDSCTYERVASLIKSAFHVSDSTLFEIAEYHPLTFPALEKERDDYKSEAATMKRARDDWKSAAETMQAARDEYRRESHAAQVALSHALRERDHAKKSQRLADSEIIRLHHVLATENSTVTADRDRLLGELQTARASLNARVTTATLEAFDDMQELRARAEAYKKTRAKLAEKYGICDAEEWQQLCMENAAAMIALQTLRDKLGV